MPQVQEPKKNNGTKSHANGAAKGVESLDHRQLLSALRAFRRGEFDVRLPDDLAGVDGQIAEAFNELTQFAEGLRTEVVEMRQTVGREGRTHKRLSRGAARGGWGD